MLVLIEPCPVVSILVRSNFELSEVAFSNSTNWITVCDSGCSMHADVLQPDWFVSFEPVVRVRE